MTKLMIIGAGGHGKVVADCAEAMNQYDEIVFADAIYPSETINSHWPTVTSDKDWSKYLEHYEFIVAIGNSDTRLAITQNITNTGGRLATLIHPRAVVSPYSTIGKGSVVFANAVIGIDSLIGAACIINHNATVDHDCQLGDACHIAPGANISGEATLGNKVWAGVGCSVIQCCQLVDNVYLGAGTVVIKDIEQAGTYVGNPARKL
ncbi:acetyltransferase [Thalassotalea euphylliae]|uniref:Acetyltransferase n=1 Tax=Thalassotalea euphylliae TaxID=1655234 RepID=A0A3E0U495_9GAMM|nr:acetyltransferase [Thalassotalea euphylliae]REL31560.1 acetyltransferase [Thalassotalea euphylliae]